MGPGAKWLSMGELRRRSLLFFSSAFRKINPPSLASLPPPPKATADPPKLLAEGGWGRVFCSYVSLDLPPNIESMLSLPAPWAAM